MPSQTPLELAFEPEPYREPIFSLRRPSRSILSRFIAHLLVRLLLVAPLPANLQAAAALFPVSMLWSLVPSSDQVPADEATLACAHPENRVRGINFEIEARVEGEAAQAAELHRGYSDVYGGIAAESSVARYYDPSTARFTTQDSFLGQPDNPPSLHRYLYAAANPTKYVDPTGHDFTLDSTRKYGVDDVAAPVLSGTVSHEDLQAYLNYVDKHGTHNQRLGATLGATGVYSDAYVQGVAKMETAAVAGTVAGMPVALAGGSAVAVGAVAGGTEGFVAGLLDDASAKALALRTAAGAALGGAFGWMASKVGGFIEGVVGEGAPAAAGGSKVTKPAVKPMTGEPAPVPPGGAGSGVADMPPQMTFDPPIGPAPKQGSAPVDQVEVLAENQDHLLNAAIGEVHGYYDALDNGLPTIRGPVNSSSQGADTIHYDPSSESIILRDAKYRREGGRYPSKVSPEKLDSWKADLRTSVDALPEGPLKDAAKAALEAERIVGDIFRWPPQ